VADRLDDPLAAIKWLVDTIGMNEKRARGRSSNTSPRPRHPRHDPHAKVPVLERFFDEAGGMQLVLHAPFGSRVNRAWGLALRKRFCRSFNFELQAAATEDAIILSLDHSTASRSRTCFQFSSRRPRSTCWCRRCSTPRCSHTLALECDPALAVLRFRGGRKVPTPLQRMEAEDLVAAVFPDQLACPENLVGDREIPDHPLVIRRSPTACSRRWISGTEARARRDGGRPVHPDRARHDGAFAAVS